MNELSLFSILESLHKKNTPQRKVKMLSAATQKACPLFAAECSKLEDNFAALTNMHSVTMSLAADASTRIDTPETPVVECVKIEEVLLPAMRKSLDTLRRWMRFKHANIRQECRAVDKTYALSVIVSALLFVSAQDEKTWKGEDPLDAVMPADHIRKIALLVLVADFLHPILTADARRRLSAAIEVHGGHRMPNY